MTKCLRKLVLRTSSNLGADIVSYGFKYRIHYEVEVSNNSSASLHAVEVDKHYFSFAKTF